MGKIKHPSTKKALSKANSKTKWAPFWAVLKVFGKTRRVHPSRITDEKRSWRRGKIKI